MHISHLPELIRRVSFVQAIYCVTDNTLCSQDLIRQLENRVGQVVRAVECGKQFVILALPHYALLELSEIVVRQSSDVNDTKQNLQGLIEALLDRPHDAGSAIQAQKSLVTQSTTSHLTHDIHYYKAKFFPRMARSMLNTAAKRVGIETPRVVDNFVGSGTTLLEASLLGFPSIGLDIDPLSVLIAQTKTDALMLDSAFVAHEVGSALSMLIDPPKGQLSLFDYIDDASISDEIRFPDWLMKNRRMTPAIAEKLAGEIRSIQRVIACCDPELRNFFRVLMSDAIARRVRFRFLGTGVGRFSLSFSETPLARLYARSLKHYVKVVAACEWLREHLHLNLATATAMLGDARNVPHNLGRFDVLLTSPPYLPAASGRESYAKARTPSLIALGMMSHTNVDELANGSVGSMDAGEVELSSLTEPEREVVMWLQKDELREIKAIPTARYFLDMRQTLAEMKHMLHPGAMAVIVSGKQSTFYKFSSREVLYTVMAAEILADEAERAGFIVQGLFDLPLRKSNMNARPRSLDDYYETLIVLQKPN